MPAVACGCAPVNQWFHLTGVYDAAAKTASLYLDGTLVKTETVSFSAWDSDAAMTVGTSMVGDLDDVQVYQLPLAAADVAALLPGAGAAVSKQVGPFVPQAASDGTPAGMSNFKYDHLSLEDCEKTPPNAQKPEAHRIQEHPYSSCWTGWVTMGTYEIEEDEEKKRGKKAGNKVTKPNATRPAGILGLLGLSWEMANQWHADTLLRFRVTWVLHGYLGNAAGNAVVNAEGSGLKPQNMKLFARMTDFGIFEDGDRRTDHDELLKDLRVEFDMQLESDTSSPCRVVAGQTQQKKVREWESTNYVTFTAESNPTYQGRNQVCTIKPLITQFGPQDFTLRLWSQEIIGKRGERFGVLRHGQGRAEHTLYAPHFRCDMRVLGRSEEVDDGVPDHTGGCVNSRAHRVFTMSKSGNANFRQVIDHIEDALNQDTNKTTYPPLRPGHDWSNPEFPPNRKAVGTEQPKKIPGNWADPTSLPLTKRPSGEDNINRGFFSNIKLNVDFGEDGKAVWDKDRGTNFCKYYFREKYPFAKELTKYPPGGGLQCDEYPFAATYEGAAGRDGKGTGHYSIRAVSATHNGLHGSASGNFYADYRVNASDSFWVLIVP
ncbi:hypothetical protein JYK22_38755, partial [Nonomuraea sp. RK-328]|nr:hypothetical protein [Nonomuraea sp. RK-328]